MMGLTSGPGGQRGLGGGGADHVGHVGQDGLALGDPQHLPLPLPGVAHVDLAINGKW